MLDPVAFNLFGLKIYWYGIVYSIGFLLSYFFVMHYSKSLKIKKEIVENIYFNFMIFSVLGGRIFEVLFYNLNYYIQDPIRIFYVHQGGMSIHGGMFFGFLVIYYYSQKYKFNIYKITDLFVIPASLFLSFGRIANFINQELVGIVTENKFFGVVFNKFDNQLRHPTTIYESIKNIFTFQIIYYLYIFKNLKPGTITAYFLILYNSLRFIIDFLRTPTIDLGFISMGQLLCLIYTIWGIIILYKIRNK